MDYISIGSVPYDEPCAQVGSQDYRKQSLIESAVFVDMLTRLFPPVGKAYFAPKSFPHDFGTYHEVCAFYDENSEEEIRWAINAENHTPGNWDETAQKKLVEKGYNPK